MVAKKKNVLEIVGLNEFGHNHIKPLQDLKDYINRKQIFFCCFTCFANIKRSKINIKLFKLQNIF